MNKVLISGYYGFGNFGDEAILSILCLHLKSLNIMPAVLSVNPDLTSKNNDVRAVGSFNIKSVIYEIFKTDILISGGGSLLQDVTSLKSLIYYSFIIFLALILRKKVIIFAQGIGPLKKSLSKFIVFNLLRHCAIVSVRDNKSLELLQNHGINAFRVNDPIFSLPINEVEKTQTVGIQLRSFASLSEEFLDNLAKNTAENFKNKKIELLSLQDTLDIPTLKTFQNKLLNYGINSELISNLDQDEVINKIASFDILIGMRFHAILVALKSNVKILTINYDEKVEKLANEFDLPMLNLNKFQDYDEIFAKFINTSQNRTKSFPTFDWTEFDKIFI